jgi:hypothetical protein
MTNSMVSKNLRSAVVITSTFAALSAGIGIAAAQVVSDPPRLTFQNQGMRENNGHSWRDEARSYQPAQRARARESYSVYDMHGRRVGSDPDPTVRSQLAHDPGQGLD